MIGGLFVRYSYLVFLGLAGIVGGIAAILQLFVIPLAWVVRVDPSGSGVDLMGNYVVRPSLAIACVVFVIALGVLIKIAIDLRRQADSPELLSLRQSYSEAITSTKHIATGLYPELAGGSRLDTVEKHVKFLVNKDGDTQAEEVVVLRCVDKPAHCRRFGATADPGSLPAKDFQSINWAVSEIAQDGTEQRLYWLPETDQPREKRSLVFFREMSQGEQKMLKIRWNWKGLCTELFALGSMDYTIRLKDSGAIRTTNFTFTITFEPDCPATKMEKLGNHSDTAGVRMLTGTEKGWVYNDASFNADGNVRTLKISTQ